MANKYVALLLVVGLVVAGAVEDQPGAGPKSIHPQATPQECYNYCYNACLFPSAFCNWMCGGRCKNPIFFDNVDGKDARKFLGPSLPPVSPVTPKEGRYHLN